MSKMISAVVGSPLYTTKIWNAKKQEWRNQTRVSRVNIGKVTAETWSRLQARREGEIVRASVVANPRIYGIQKGTQSIPATTFQISKNATTFRIPLGLERTVYAVYRIRAFFRNLFRRD